MSEPIQNALRVPCPLCGDTVTVSPEDLTVQVSPPEQGKQLKRATIQVTAIGVTNHVHGRSKA